MKHLFICLIALFSILCSFSSFYITPLQAEILDRIVAIVNDDIITESELQEEGEDIFRRIEAEAPEWQRAEATKQARKQLLEQLIDKLLLKQRAAQYGISVSDSELDTSLANIMQDNQTTVEEFKSKLEGKGHSYEKYREMIRTQILQAKMINYEVRSKVVITDEKIQDYYNRHYIEKNSGQGYHVLQIGVAWERPDEDISQEEAKDRAESLRKKVLAGANFRDIAQDFSDLPSKIDGGDIGVIPKEEMASYMKKAILSMQPGDVSDVIETPAGYQFFKLLSVREGEVITQAPYDQVKEEIRQQLYDEELKSHFNKWVSDLRGNAFIKKNI